MHISQPARTECVTRRGELQTEPERDMSPSGMFRVQKELVLRFTLRT